MFRPRPVDVFLPLLILLDGSQRHAAQFGKLFLAQAVLLTQKLEIAFRLRCLNKLMKSGLSALAYPAGSSSFPTILIQNTVPEFAIMRQSEKHEQQCL